MKDDLASPKAANPQSSGDALEGVVIEPPEERHGRERLGRRPCLDHAVIVLARPRRW